MNAFVMLILVDLLNITVKAFLLTQFHFYICSTFTDCRFLVDLNTCWFLFTDVINLSYRPLWKIMHAIQLYKIFFISNIFQVCTNYHIRMHYSFFTWILETFLYFVQFTTQATSHKYTERRVWRYQKSNQNP